MGEAQTNDLDTLLYWIFANLTFSMAVEYELAHRVEGQDFWVVLFRHQAELLSKLNTNWVVRWGEEKRPYFDEAGVIAGDLGI